MSTARRSRRPISDALQPCRNPDSGKHGGDQPQTRVKNSWAGLKVGCFQPLSSETKINARWKEVHGLLNGDFEIPLCGVVPLG